MNKKDLVTNKEWYVKELVVLASILPGQKPPRDSDILKAHREHILISHELMRSQLQIYQSLSPRRACEMGADAAAL